MYYKIADCFVKYEPNYMYMQKKIKPYEERFHGESENSCIYLGYKSDAYYKKKQKMHPEITCEKLEYVYVGAEFNRKILKYVRNGQACLSADPYQRKQEIPARVP